MSRLVVPVLADLLQNDCFDISELDYTLRRFREMTRAREHVLDGAGKHCDFAVDDELESI